MDLSHALWIGGPQGSGKSSIAWELSRRFDLQLYAVDARTWVHEERMPATEFRGLSMDERWLHASAEQMLECFVVTSRHRFRLVLEDLAALPDAPGIVVEGPQLFPPSVAAVVRSREQALFLLPDPAEMRERLERRGPLPGTSDGEQARRNATERDLLIARQFERDVNDLRLPFLRVDAPLEEMIERAAALVAPIVRTFPAGGDLAAVRRFENDVVATQVRLYLASLGDDAPPEWEFPFACECGEPGCRDVVELTPSAYEQLSAGGDRSPLLRPTP